MGLQGMRRRDSAGHERQSTALSLGAVLTHHPSSEGWRKFRAVALTSLVIRTYRDRAAARPQVMTDRSKRNLDTPPALHPLTH